MKRTLFTALLLAGCIEAERDMRIFEPVPVTPANGRLSASNVAENDASVWAATAWTSRTSAADSDWQSVAFGDGAHVAVASAGGNRVMRSTDGGVTWAAHSAASALQWQEVAFGNGLFVAVAFDAGTTSVMTSPTGVTWTTRTCPAKNWRSVTYGNGLFVAVAGSGANDRVMTSPDGITWTTRTAPNANWTSVTYGNGLFVAVADNSAPRVMTSPDGITWTTRDAPLQLWQSVAYGNGLFVAVAASGTGNRVMTSADGITWASRASAADLTWNGVTFGNGRFVAVAANGTGSRVMTSRDGITWVSETSAADLLWQSVAYGNGQFAAVAQSGTGNRAMTFQAPSYNFEQQVIYTPDKHLYEVLAINGTSDDPAAGAALDNPTWLDLGPINRWKMFDGAVTIQTTNAVKIDVTIAPGTNIDAVAVLNADGYEVQVVRSSTSYDETQVLGGDKDLVFRMPTAASGSIQVIIWGDAAHTGGTAYAGEVLIGLQEELGVTNFGTKVGIIDYSRKETDEFGNTVITERAFSKRADFDVTVETPDVGAVQNRLAELRAVPTVYIGDEDRSETIIYGFYRRFDIVLGQPSISACALQVEGLT